MPRVTITVPDKNAQPYRFQLDREVVTLGRGIENDIAIDSGSVSVNHAEMRRVEGGYELHDVGSTNGIKLDGQRLLAIPLHNGAEVHIGDVAFDFLLTEDELQALASERPDDTLQSAIIHEADVPVSAPKPARKPTPYVVASSGGGFGSTLLFVFFAVIAFYAGLAIRHQKETGASLLDGIRAHQATKTAPAGPGQN